MQLFDDDEPEPARSRRTYRGNIDTWLNAKSNGHGSSLIKVGSFFRIDLVLSIPVSFSAVTLSTSNILSL